MASYVIEHDGHRITVEVHANGRSLELYIAGYGEPDACRGEGSPVFLDIDDDNRLRVVVSPDINDESKRQVIDLEDAREDRVDWLSDDE